MYIYLPASLQFSLYLLLLRLKERRTWRKVRPWLKRAYISNPQPELQICRKIELVCGIAYGYSVLRIALRSRSYLHRTLQRLLLMHFSQYYLLNWSIRCRMPDCCHRLDVNPVKFEGEISE